LHQIRRREPLTKVPDPQHESHRSVTSKCAGTCQKNTVKDKLVIRIQTNIDKEEDLSIIRIPA
jgi:hypothetical protein